MSLLSVIIYMCGRTNVPVPATVMGNTDPLILQMLRLLEEEGNDLARRHDWEILVRESETFTTLADEDQGAIETLAEYGFRHIQNGTFWDRTNKLPVLGPLSDREWAALKAMATTGPRFHYRLRGGHLWVNPVPAAGYEWFFEYVSKYWILSGATYKQTFALDTDTILLPEDLVLAGLRWRWKKEKGLDYAEDFETYERQVKDAMGADGGKRTLCMDGSVRGPQPGIFVSDMSWDL